MHPAVAPKLRPTVYYLQDMEWEEEPRAVPDWRAHGLTGDRKGNCSLSVAANWRPTFRIDRAAGNPLVPEPRTQPMKARPDSSGTSPGMTEEMSWVSRPSTFRGNPPSMGDYPDSSTGV